MNEIYFQNNGWCGNWRLVFSFISVLMGTFYTVGKKCHIHSSEPGTKSHEGRGWKGGRTGQVERSVTPIRIDHLPISKHL